MSQVSTLQSQPLCLHIAVFRIYEHTQCKYNIRGIQHPDNWAKLFFPRDTFMKPLILYMKYSKEISKNKNGRKVPVIRTGHVEEYINTYCSTAWFVPCICQHLRVFVTEIYTGSSILHRSYSGEMALCFSECHVPGSTHTCIHKHTEMHPAHTHTQHTHKL